jgi:hypothetical protein
MKTLLSLVALLNFTFNMLLQKFPTFIAILSLVITTTTIIILSGAVIIIIVIIIIRNYRKRQ